MITVTPRLAVAVGSLYVPHMPASAILGLVALLKIVLLVGLAVWLYRRARRHELRRASWRR